MKDLRLLDLESRKGKAPGGYQVNLEEARYPFIFMNAVGLDGDIRTLCTREATPCIVSPPAIFPFHPTGHAPWNSARSHP